MVGVVVAGGDHINKIQLGRVNDQPGHSDVGLVGSGVFFREGIGEVGVEEQVLARPFYQKTALAEPPAGEALGVGGRLADFGEEWLVFLEGMNHG